MIFSVIRSSNPQHQFAPWQIEIDGAPFLDGIEFEAEAHSICRLLCDLEPSANAYQTRKAEVIPMRPRSILRKSKQTFTPRQWAAEILEEIRRPLRDRKQRGQALLEMALLLPIALLLLLGALDMFIAQMDKSNISYLATQAANCAALLPAGSCSPAAYIANAESGLSLSAAQLSFTQVGNTITVTYAYQPIGPFWPAMTLNASATAVAP